MSLLKKDKLDTALIQRDEGGRRPDVIIGILVNLSGIASCEPNRVSHLLWYVQ